MAAIVHVWYIFKLSELSVMINIGAQYVKS